MPLLFAYGKNRFSPDVVQIKNGRFTVSACEVNDELGKQANRITTCEVNDELGKQINRITTCEVNNELGKQINRITTYEVNNELGKQINRITTCEVNNELGKSTNRITTCEVNDELGKQINSITTSCFFSHPLPFKIRVLGAAFQNLFNGKLHPVRPTLPFEISYILIVLSLLATANTCPETHQETQ